MRRCITLCGAALLAFAAQEARAVTYNYVGNTFTSITDAPQVGESYDTTMRVTGFFTVAAPLQPNLVDVNPTFIDASLNDGRLTNSISGGAYFGLGLSTDAAGNIIKWVFSSYWASGPVEYNIITQNGDGGQLDFAQISICTFLCIFHNIDSALNHQPGTWSVTNVTTPVPAALPLFASGLAVLGWAARRRQRLASL